MTLREIVDDLELQRLATLKDNARRADQELQDAIVRLKAAKERAEVLRRDYHWQRDFKEFFHASIERPSELECNGSS